MKAKYITLIVLAVLAVILVLQNWYDVLIQLFFWNQEMPLAVFAILMMAIGFLLGLVTARVTRGEPQKD
ncbi:MAG: LapA family protein [bacterium]|nr:LapA family protein [bacterium]